jgi:hypothetical protein
VAFESLLFALHAGCAAALALGARTRLATFACWLLLASLHHRNPFVLIGADTMLRLLLFWSLFLPLGARWSWDARRAEPARSGRALGVASAALLLQVAAVYPIAAAWKRREPVWQELRFFREAMQVEGVATALGRKLLALPDAALSALTWLALQLEAWAFLLAFVPLATGPFRALAVALFLAFHLAGLGTTMSLGLFPIVMAVAWLPFVPSWLYERLGGARADAAPVRSPLAADFLAGCAAIGIALHLAGGLAGAALPESRAQPAGAVLRHLGLEQGWSLWSRPPANRTYVFAAHLRDGRSVDLHRDGAPLDWDASRRRSANNRWWKYQLLVAEPIAAPTHAPLYAAWLTREWNDAHPPEAAIETLELWMLSADGRVRLWPAP